MEIVGSTVILYEKTQSGVDGFNNPIYTESPVEVENVLIGEPTTDDITDSVNLYGKKIAYMLGIPKGDTHDWTNKIVEWSDAYGHTFKCKTFGLPITGIEENLPPLPWHMKVRCESYGESRD